MVSQRWAIATPAADGTADNTAEDAANDTADDATDNTVDDWPARLARPGGLLRFDEASRLVVDHLHQVAPMGCWSVTRYQDDTQIQLTVDDRGYGLAEGDVSAWRDSMCRPMVARRAPTIAPDVDAVPAYRTTGERSTLTVNAYCGVPLRRADGRLFGTLRGLDPARRDPRLTRHAPLLTLLGTLLGGILELDRQQAEAERRLERTQLDAETDLSTGLLNRHGWDRRLELEEDRYRRFGDPATVLAIDLDLSPAGGNASGDGLDDERIRLAAHTLREAMRPGDILARVGDDDFRLLAHNITGDVALALLRRLAAALERAGLPARVVHAPYSVGGGFALAGRSADRAMSVVRTLRPGA